MEISSFYKCTKNHDHMLYSSWDMTWNRCYCYFSFSAIFCPFTPLTAQKMKMKKKWKKHLDISSFYTSIPKIMIIYYTFRRYGTWQMLLFFIVGYFFPLKSPNSPKNQSLKKMKKWGWRCHHFTHVYHKLWLDDVWFLRYGTQQTDGQTDRQMDRQTDRKSAIAVGAPPKNKVNLSKQK